MIYFKHLEIKEWVAGLDIGKIWFNVIAMGASIAIKKIPGDLFGLVCPDCRRKRGDDLRGIGLIYFFFNCSRISPSSLSGMSRSPTSTVFPMITSGTPGAEMPALLFIST